ncbi:MAG: hypothetical protein [Olavius algarvensis Delta 4 endosymbiont]|nr:MAG: hypothetical protein [Olavius algarvensis Delta 4 endosymbiont]
MSFGPISALGGRLQASKYLSIPPVATHNCEVDQAGSPATRGYLAAALILNQNPIFR